MAETPGTSDNFVETGADKESSRQTQANQQQVLRDWRLPRPIELWSMLGLALFGVCVSVYLVITHYEKAALVCSGSGLINCEKVTTSPQSVIAGIPVAYFGVFYFLVVLCLVLPFAWKKDSLVVLRQVVAGCGMVMVLYLVYVELFLVKAICLWCSSVHVATFLLFSLILFATTSRTARGITARRTRQRA